MWACQRRRHALRPTDCCEPVFTPHSHSLQSRSLRQQQCNTLTHENGHRKQSAQRRETGREQVGRPAGGSHNAASAVLARFDTIVVGFWAACGGPMERAQCDKHNGLGFEENTAPGRPQWRGQDTRKGNGGMRHGSRDVYGIAVRQGVALTCQAAKTRSLHLNRRKKGPKHCENHTQHGQKGTHATRRMSTRRVAFPVRHCHHVSVRLYEFFGEL